MEFRLCREYFGRKAHYTTYVAELVLERLSDISLRLSQKYADNNYLVSCKKRHDSQNEYAAAIMDPVRFEKFRSRVETETKNTDENRSTYVDKLMENGPFTSLDDIMNSIHSLNTKIAKQNANT